MSMDLQDTKNTKKQKMKAQGCKMEVQPTSNSNQSFILGFLGILCVVANSRHACR